MNDKINGRTPEEIKKGLECRKQGYAERCGYDCSKCDVYVPGYLIGDLLNDALAYIQQLERERDEARNDLDTLNYANTELNSAYEAMKRERDAAVRAARWQFERRGKDGVTELPVCSGCGATPKYYAPKNDVGMQVPPYCHECGSKMDDEVKYENA